MVFVTSEQTLGIKWWCVIIVMMTALVIQVTSLNGPNVCMVKQKYNITKRVKYRAPMSIRTYVWCLSIPPRCSKYTTEMRDLTRLETEERTAEVAVCCPGYKMRDVSCVPICPNGKTGSGCSEDCPPNKWGPNCVNECSKCWHGDCLPTTGECHCQRGWQGESCDLRMTTTTTATPVEEHLTTYTSTKTTSLPTTPAITTISTTSATKTTASSTLPVTLSASTPTTSSVTPIVSFTIVTLPITTSIKTTETIQTTTEKSKTTSQITTESQNARLTTPLKPVAEIMAQTNPQTVNTTAIFVHPTTASSIGVRIIPTLASKNSLKVPEVVNISTVLTTEQSKEVSTITTVPKTTLKLTTPIAVIPTTEPQPLGKKNVTSISSAVTSTTKSNPTTELAKMENETVNLAINTISKETTSITPLIIKEAKAETTKKPETTLRISTTAKFKPKEIWIKPAQKGETIETKKILHDASKHRVATNKEFTINTTPKTIIVSIIPTSVSYATYKKIALTTASFMFQKGNTTTKLSKPTEGFTKPMSTQIYTTPTTIKATVFPAATIKPTKSDVILLDKPSKVTFKNTSPKNEINKTNSMTAISNQTKAVINSSTTIPSVNAVPTTDKKLLLTTPTASTTTALKNVKPTHKMIIERKNNTKIMSKPVKMADEKKSNNTKTLITHEVTEKPEDEEMFHILTEPEHITAVMGEKETGRSSIDLVSVISIAGGVMMAVITMAVVIVMIERCRRPRYEDVRKMNDIHMQVMIDGNDAPPPYVRSIFHSPLPEPPMSEKCHYQPISTLDRNLK